MSRLHPHTVHKLMLTSENSIFATNLLCVPNYISVSISSNGRIKYFFDILDGRTSNFNIAVMAFMLKTIAH